MGGQTDGISASPRASGTGDLLCGSWEAERMVGLVISGPRPPVGADGDSAAVLSCGCRSRGGISHDPGGTAWSFRRVDPRQSHRSHRPCGFGKRSADRSLYGDFIAPYNWLNLRFRAVVGCLDRLFQEATKQVVRIVSAFVEQNRQHDTLRVG